jgi:hypothetical protein
VLDHIPLGSEDVAPEPIRTSGAVRTYLGRARTVSAICQVTNPTSRT